MKYHLVLPCFAVISAFLITTAYSVTIQGRYDVNDTSSVFIVKKVLELQCNVSENTNNAPLTWKKGGNELPPEFKNRMKTRTVNETTYTLYFLKITDATDNDIGNYTCEVDGKITKFRVITKIYVKVEKNINIVEGEVLKIRCDTRGTPPPRISWKFTNETCCNKTYDDSSDRIKLSPYKGVENAMLQIEGIQKYERGVYMCMGNSVGTDDIEGDPDSVNSTCTVRVKDKYAAVWPFLGICAEVFVLCLIIFIYEKKRNKTELEESDTDQSPDQKNTPDHGKESNLRHRQ